MKRLFLLVMFFSTLLLSCEKEKEIDVDDNFDVCSAMDDYNFKKYCYKCFDANRDGIVSMFEASLVDKIDLESEGIKSLKGIEYFTNLTHLYCNLNYLKVLDVSKNRALTFLACGSNDLTSLDISSNTELVSLVCSYNNLSTEALNSLFESLPITENGYISFFDNPGSATCDRSIYEAKGWEGYGK